MNHRSIRDIPLRNQLVFVRCDFNVPLDDDCKITEDGRIKAALTTIEYIIEKGGRVVLGSHLGRPNGKRVASMSLQPVAKRLSDYLGQDVHFVEDCIGPEVTQAKKRLKAGEVLLLENLRYYDEEKKNDMHFAQQLAEDIDVYIAEGFGVVHRKHASTFALPSLIFDKGVGFLIERELEGLGKIIGNPDQPLVVMVGGIKISDKVDVIKNLAPISEVVLVGGGVANTFLKAQGHNIGASIVESDSVGAGQEEVNYVEVAGHIWKQFESERVDIDVKLPDGSALSKIQVPIDFIAAPNTDVGAETKIIEIGVNEDEMPDDWLYLDIGPKSQKLFAEVFAKARTIFWNGPVGLFEIEAYAAGSKAIAQAVADNEGYAVLGGGDTEVVIKKFGLDGHFSHVSTGGGASLTFLAQKDLPGLGALQ